MSSCFECLSNLAPDLGKCLKNIAIRLHFMTLFPEKRAATAAVRPLLSMYVGSEKPDVIGAHESGNFPVDNDAHR